MSRNHRGIDGERKHGVAPREGRVSRNSDMPDGDHLVLLVAPREGRVSRNSGRSELRPLPDRRAPRGACE